MKLLHLLYNNKTLSAASRQGVHYEKVFPVQESNLPDHLHTTYNNRLNNITRALTGNMWHGGVQLSTSSPRLCRPTTPEYLLFCSLVSISQTALIRVAIRRAHLRSYAYVDWHLLLCIHSLSRQRYGAPISVLILMWTGTYRLRYWRATAELEPPVRPQTLSLLKTPRISRQEAHVNPLLSIM